MKDRRIQFTASQFDYGNRVGILAYIPDADGRRGFVGAPMELVMVKREDTDTSIEAGTLELAPAPAQSLMEALWAAGLRPSALKGDPHPELIRRIGAHLEDMRTIAFAKLEVQGPSLSEIIASARGGR